MKVFIFQMYIYIFLNYIGEMFAIIVNTVRKTFVKVVYYSTDHFM